MQDFEAAKTGSLCDRSPVSFPTLSFCVSPHSLLCASPFPLYRLCVWDSGRADLIGWAKCSLAFKQATWYPHVSFFTSSKFLSPYSKGILCSIIVAISLVTVLLSDPLNFQQSSGFNLRSFAGRVNRWESPTPAPLPFTLALLQGCGNVVGAKDVCDAHFPPGRTE